MTSRVITELDTHLPGEPSKVTGPAASHATRLARKGYNTVQMAMAESYVGGLEVPDKVLGGFFDFVMPFFLKHCSSLLCPYDWVASETEVIAGGSKELMKIQYDRPQAMLNLMLGDSKFVYPKYSMGLWENGATTLEESQIHMIDDVIRKLGIQDGDHILDFGCGWGCVPNYILSKFPNVRFTGINLSHEQCEYMRRKMQDPESHLSSGRFTLVEGDLNEAHFDEKFDKILSIGVLCHIGNLTKTFKKLASFLKAEGRVFIHIITVRTPNNISSPFTHKYIFPHGRFWNHEAIPNCCQDLKLVQRWYLNGNNYRKTLTAWLNNFDKNQQAIKDLDYGMDYGRFRRIWRFYLIWFISIFASCDGEYNGNGQYLLVHA